MSNSVCMIAIINFSVPGVIAVNGSYFGDGEGPYLLSDTVCTKYRNRLLHCSRQRGVHEYTSECSPGHSAGVICEGMRSPVAAYSHLYTIPTFLF